ncbi:MAG: triple tyrosine motif-containing protein [Gracilimonas sp.]
MLLNTIGVIAQSNTLRLIQNYTLEDFENSRQNWVFQQTEDNKILVGNSNAINMFDGVDWTYTHVPKGQVIFSMDKSPDGKIYAGGDGEIGFIREDSLNRIDFESLLDKIPPDQRVFTGVRQTHYLKRKIYFRSIEALFVYDEKADTVKVLTHEDSIFNSFKIKDRIYVDLEGVGLAEVVENTFVPVPNTERYASDRIYGILPFEDDLLIYSRSNGFKIFDGVTFKNFGDDVNDYLAEYSGYRMLWLDSERIAVGTLSGGLLILNKDGDVLQIITTEEGLNNNFVYGLYLDHQNLLWVALDDGISVLDTEPEMEVYDERWGLSGYVFEIYEEEDHLIVITNQGAYSKQKELNEKFYKISSAPDHFYDAVKINGVIYGASSEGLFRVFSNSAQKINDKLYLSLVSDGNSSFFGLGRSVIESYNITSTELEIYILYSGEELLSGIGAYHDGKLFVGFESGEIGIINDTNRLLGGSEILADEEVTAEYLGVLGTDLFLGTQQHGLFEYSGTSNSFKKNKIFENKFISDSQVSHFTECFDSYWFRANRKILRFDRQGELIETSLFNNIAYEEGVFTINCGIDKTWFGGESKVYAVPDDLDKLTAEYPTNITGIYIKNDSLLYGGFNKPKEEIILPYTKNELRFTFAAASYINPDRNQYQVKLEGFDNNWTPWNSETQKDYTNIPEGDYTFLVRSKNVYEVEGSTASISFSILPPWYRTWWAYLIYTLTISGILYTAYKIRVNQLLRVERIRNNIASDLHDEVSATLSSISYFAEAIQSDKVKKDKDRFVKLIANSAGDAKEKITDIVWAINPEHDDWRAFLSKCRRFSSDLLESKGIKYSLKIDEYIPGKLDMQLRQHLWLIFKEMVTNAVRHSEAKQLDVIFKYENGMVKLVVQDDGKGMDVDQVRKGNGLVNIQKRADLIDGDITLKTSEGFGTRWILKITLR